MNKFFKDCENGMEEYNAYILSDEFRKDYEKLKEKYYPDVDPESFFNDVLMFDNEGNLIKYPEYSRLYSIESPCGK
jgi:hypothetical protein